MCKTYYNYYYYFFEEWKIQLKPPSRAWRNNQNTIDQINLE